MNILFLRGFNNYFNRVIKKYSALADYQADCTAYVNFEGINFNPNDGVVTELVLGNESQKENSLPLDWENIGTPDYCVCYQMEGNPSAAVIKSRWFILESERLRSGQYRIALKRDVVAEHFDTIKVSPCFIEKGMINDVENTLLYNKESMTYNQIKDAEYLLKDTSGCGWVVGYVAKNAPTEATTAEATILMESEPVDYYDSSDLPFTVGTGTHYAYDQSQMEIELSQLGGFINTQWAANKYSCTQYMFSYIINPNNTITISNYSYKMDGTINGYNTAVSGRPSGVSNVPTKLYENGYWYGDVDMGYRNLHHIRVQCTSSSQQTPGMYGFGGPLYSHMQRSNNSITSILTTLKSHCISACSTAFSSYGPIVDGMEQYNGKIVKYNNKYYTMDIQKVSYRSGTFKVNASSDWSVTTSSTQIDGLTQYNSTISDSTDLSNLRNDISTFISTAYLNETSAYKIRDGFECCGISMPRYSIKLTSMSTETVSVDLTAYTGRSVTYDSPVDIFAIPYGEISFRTTIGGTQYYTSKNEALAAARAIAFVLGDNVCYDLQVVPYCPIPSLRPDPRSLQLLILSRFAANSYAVINRTVGGTTEPCSFMMWASSCKGTFDIDLVINNYDYNYSNALNAKINNETTLCRLASPNFNGMFEFSLAKNNGITKFNVDYTYKPYAPYIHINPDFKFIYGQDWDDARGLICGGDFSLSFMSSYWQTYQNNNKNYQAIFDRQIQNMDVNNAIALEKQQFQATVGTITSAVGGALGGGAAGATAGAAAGPWGALIGGVVGAVGGGVGSGLASAYGAEKDKDWLQRQQAEARSYAIDMYGYQLGNIQAMPYSLSRTESLTNNNKIWPILELYKPTDLEIQLLADKIRYNGMTIMAVGNIQDYCTSNDFGNVFIKGQLIRLTANDINDDFHIADAIYQEINKGVYIPSGGL